MRAKYGEPLKWLKAALLVETDDCVLWPYAATNGGYGQVRVGRERMQAHRYVCIEAHGAPPSPTHTDAAHSCGNRLCCNKRHVRHATSLENSADAAVHGTILAGERHPRAKLTTDQVKEIKALLSTRGPTALAREYGVSHKAIGFIRDGVNWASVSA